MNPTLVTIATIALAMVSGRLLMRRFPTVSKAQVFCAIAAWVGGVLIAGRPAGSLLWHYTGLAIAVFAGSFLVFAALRRWDIMRPSGPA
jgi:hypothetical protein